MNSTSYWYFHTDQWRYETLKPTSCCTPAGKNRNKGYSAGRLQRGLHPHGLAAFRARTSTATPWNWPTRPPRPAPPTRRARPSTSPNSSSPAPLDVAFADPDNPVNWPRNLIVWRGNLIGTSAKGHEYFLKHLLGAQNGVLQEGGVGNDCKEVKWHENAPTGKLDLMVDINFRLNSTGAYSDIILPTATWYEKNDLNTTDMHPFIHPLGPRR
jgi:nitrate reductase alpha subunit